MSQEKYPSVVEMPEVQVADDLAEMPEASLVHKLHLFYQMPGEGRPFSFAYKTRPKSRDATHKFFLSGEGLYTFEVNCYETKTPQHHKCLSMSDAIPGTRMPSSALSSFIRLEALRYLASKLL